MWPRRMGCSQVPRTRSWASASSSALGHSTRVSGVETPSISNWRLRRKAELAGGAERPADEPAHAFGIADADLIGFGGDVVAEGTLGVADAAGNGESAAAGFGGEIGEGEAVGVKEEVAGDVAEAGGEIGGASGGAGDARAVEGALDGGVNLGEAGDGERASGGGLVFGAWEEGIEEAEVHGAIELESDGAGAIELGGAGDGEVAVRTLEAGRVDFEFLAGGAEMDGAGVLEGNGFRAGAEAHEEAGEASVGEERAGILEGAGDGDFAVGDGVADGFLGVDGGDEEGFEINVADLDFAGDGKGRSESDIAAAGDFAGGHGGAELEMGVAAIGDERAVEA